MLQFILIVLLAQDINANLGYRNYYKPHPGYYGMQKGYGYKKPYDGYKKVVNTYKNPGTAVAPYCRCTTETTMLNLVVLDQSGTPLSNAAVWVRYEGQEKEAKTDKKGFLKVEVRGCEIAIIVWHDGKQAESRIVNLEKTKTNYKNVFIQIGKACNFLIYFYSSTEPSVGKELISYLADINGGDQSTSGTATVGADASPLCINVKDGGSLKVVVTSQSADYFSVLSLDEVKEGETASMVLPFPVTKMIAKSNVSLNANSFVIGLNLYREMRCGIHPKKLECKRVPELERKIIFFVKQCDTHYVKYCRTQDYREVCRKEPKTECTTEKIFEGNHVPVQGCRFVPSEVCGDNHFRLIRLARVTVQYVKEGSVRLPFQLIRTNLNTNRNSIRSNFNSIVFEQGLEKTNVLVSVQLRSLESELYQGNAYIIDRSGVTKVVKFPSEPYSPSDWWFLGCIIDGNLKKWKEINKFGTRFPDELDEFEKLCERGIVPTLAPVPDEHEVDNNDKLDHSGTEYDLESTDKEFNFSDDYSSNGDYFDDE